jgi:uncharacterized protein with ParB-like and HNH nuclease domain
MANVNMHLSGMRISGLSTLGYLRARGLVPAVIDDHANGNGDGDDNDGDQSQEPQLGLFKGQRPYRWPASLVRQLYDDIHKQYTSNRQNTDSVLVGKPDEIDGNGGYYINAIHRVINDGKSLLLDGQQRVTTLSVLLLVIAHSVFKRLRSRQVTYDNGIWQSIAVQL